MLLTTAVLAALLIAACAIDLRQRRIPNTLNLAILAAGVLWQAAVPRGAGLFSRTDFGSLGGLTVAGGVAAMLAIGLVLWRLKVFGGGDAKLLVALSPWFGWAGVAPLLLGTFVAGGVLALSVRVARTQGWAVLDGRFPYSPAVAMGAGLTMVYLNRGVPLLPS